MTKVQQQQQQQQKEIIPYIKIVLAHLLCLIVQYHWLGKFKEKKSNLAMVLGQGNTFGNGLAGWDQKWSMSPRVSYKATK